MPRSLAILEDVLLLLIAPNSCRPAIWGALALAIAVDLCKLTERRSYVLSCRTAGTP